MKKIFYLLAFIFLVSKTFGQENKKAFSICTYKKLENVEYEIFPKEKPKEFKLTQTVKEADNSTVAGFLNSLYWEDTPEWYLYNRPKNTKADTAFLKDKKSKDFLLNYGWWGPNMSINYNEKGSRFCFLKFYWQVNEKKTTFSMFDRLLYESNKWVQTSSSPNAVFEYINPQTLSALLEGKATKNELTNQLIKKTRNKFGGLDQIRLYNAFKSWKKGSEEWNTFIQPYCVINQEPTNPAPDPIPKKGKVLPITEYKRGLPLGITTIYDEKENKLENAKGLQVFLQKVFEQKSSGNLKQFFYGNMPPVLPDLFTKTKIENLRLVNRFYIGNGGGLDSTIRLCEMWRLKDIKSGRFYTVKTIEREEIKKQGSKNTKSYVDYLGGDSFFDDLYWLFENLEPKVFLECLSYKQKENQIFPFKEIEEELTLNFLNNGQYMSLEGTYLFFQKLKAEKKYNSYFMK